MNALDVNAHQTKRTSRLERLAMFVMWLLATTLVLIAVYLGWRVGNTKAATPETQGADIQLEVIPTTDANSIELPDFLSGSSFQSISRLTKPHTIIPSRPRQDVISYTVSSGDAVFGIAQKFYIQPETILWANYDLLNDNPDMLSPGMSLNIPPVDGVYYQWQEGNTLEGIASQFKADVEDILSWTGNNIDLINPDVAPGSYIMIPGGEREFKSWIVPTIARDKSGVSKSVYGAGACEGPFEGAYGTGGFVWPTASQVLSGNDYWSGHLGIDIAGSVGDGVFASDGGVVVFAGSATGGYGYMIMIDHGNGYQTLYAHLSSVRVRCGQSVSQGGYIGAVGSTGNSTGPHLHFEVRYLGGFVSPWYVLP